VKIRAVMVTLHALAVAWLTIVAAMMFSEGKAVAGVLISLLALVIVGVTVTVVVCDRRLEQIQNGNRLPRSRLRSG
jgi:hypothetical protein